MNDSFLYDWFEPQKHTEGQTPSMNDFTQNIAQVLFDQNQINNLLHKELQQMVNNSQHPWKTIVNPSHSQYVLKLNEFLC